MEMVYVKRCVCCEGCCSFVTEENVDMVETNWPSHIDKNVQTFLSF